MEGVELEEWCDWICLESIYKVIVWGLDVKGGSREIICYVFVVI